MEHVWLWTQFVIASALIVLAGGRLSRYAGILSEKLKLGHVFVGMIFLGWITSLPELVLSLGSTIYVGEPDLAIGNVLGSCLFNLTILIAADIAIIGGIFFTLTNPRSSVTGLMSLAILCIAAAGLLGSSVMEIPAFLSIDMFSWLIIVFYIISTVFLYRHDKKHPMPEPDVPVPSKDKSSGIFTVGLASLVATAIIVGAGLYMAKLGDSIAETYGIAHSFVGTLFFAVVSSLPELSTTIAAARLGFLDMCLGNIFGSNIFNIMIIGVSDVAYQQGSIIATAETDKLSHLWVAVFAIVGTVAVIAGVRRRSPRLFWRISWVSLVVVASYVLGLFAMQLL